MVIFAAGHGLLDDLNVSRIGAWEASFRDYVRSAHPEIGEEIRTRRELSDELQGKVREAIEAHKRIFTAGGGEGPGVTDTAEPETRAAGAGAQAAGAGA